ncbi:efflux transporter outer membrane subunit [Rubrivivax gelatinosus]|uniref:Multidrug efflux system outer membrane protein n=1 Tax=Rubrivivax gelatinosus TaxID=28068 RepID=A0A4R2M898_RUBGE|nr:efflux transporter outer membrane subunit [Rubrivivax gelatinosus]MBK1688792.1 multidrug transporter [Rubrivivax gelatinosus]TCP02882.1 multidrug efflux system outer membrane protein [Rubrivivax gelatinosus]
MNRKIPFALAALTLALAGCANLAPTYERPPAPVPAAFPAAGADAASDAQRPWRQQFDDPRLVQLVELALVNNRDLRVAVASVEQARAQYRVQDAARRPTLQASGSGDAARTPADLSGTGRTLVSHSYGATVGISAYELDFFGRVRNLSEQALAQYAATEEARRASQITVVAEVAQAYLGWSADLQRMALARQTLDSRLQTVALTERRLAAGADSALALRQQQSSLESARGEVQRLKAVLATDREALAVLIGGPVPPALAPQALDPAATPAGLQIAAGLPSELLLRRPDLLESEHQLRAATANIGVARAAFYPRIALTASAGSASAELSGLFNGGSGSWSFVPQVSLPIFDGGANSANLEAARAARDIALAQYEKAIQVAFQEVAQALAEREALGERIAAQQALLKASGSALELARARWERGADSWLEVLDAQRTHDSAQQGLVDLRQQQVDNGITLYKALGGGTA